MKDALKDALDEIIVDEAIHYIEHGYCSTDSVTLVRELKTLVKVIRKIKKEKP
jgi:hypothetical protein